VALSQSWAIGELKCECQDGWDFIAGMCGGLAGHEKDSTHWQSVMPRPPSLTPCWASNMLRRELLLKTTKGKGFKMKVLEFL